MTLIIDRVHDFSLVYADKLVMLLKFIFIFSNFLSFSMVIALEPPVKSEMVECNDCNPSEVESAQTMAKAKEQELKNQINSISNSKGIDQEKFCNLNTFIYNERCTGPNGENPMDLLQQEIIQLKTQVKSRITEITSANNLNSSETGGLFQRISSALSDLKSKLEQKKHELSELNNICNDLSLKAANACIPPKIIPEEVGTKVTSANNVTLETKLLRPIIIDAPKILEKRNEVANSYISLANKVHPTQIDIKVSLEQVSATLDSLSKLTNTTNLVCVEGPFGNKCPSETDQTQNSSETTDIFKKPKDEKSDLNRPIARPNQEGSTSNRPINEQSGSKENQTQKKLTTEQLIEETQNNAYGVAPDIKTGSYQPKETTKTLIESTSGGSFFGQMGNALTELSGVAPLFNKTKGSFGNDDSYGSNRLNSRYANTTNQTNSRVFNSNTAYNPLTGNQILSKNLNNRNSNFNDQGTYDYPQNNANNQFRGNLSAGGIPMGENSNQLQRPTKNEKPGLLSRLFGRQNKTLFSDKNKSNGGFSISNSSQNNNSSYSRYNSNQSNVNIQNPNQRSFDPDKYVPTKKAQAQAFVRHKGRKIASKTSDDNINIWPKDISRNKATNIFLKVNLTYKSNLK